MKEKARELENNVYFWQKVDALLLSSHIVIDHPAGSHHRVYNNLVYPVDYGYLQDTFSVDQSPIYCYRGSLKSATVTAMFVSADILKKDLMAKLLIGCTEEETEAILKFVNSTDFQKAILVRPGKDAPNWAATE